MIIGRVRELWRYPVKSLGGECLDAFRLARHGVEGDRHWAVYDPQAPMLRSAKQWPELLQLQAQYLGQPSAEDYADAVAPVRLLAPDASQCDSTDPSACREWLCARLGRAAELRPRAPAWERAFYALPSARTEEAIAREIGLEEDEALPDFNLEHADLAAVLAQHATPPGFLYDAYPVHIITTDSLAFLAQKSGLNTDVRRFRPNLLLELTEPTAAPTEQGWLDATLAIGEAVVRIHSPTQRCSMPGRAQPRFDLGPEPGLPRALGRHLGRDLGVNAQVLTPGRIAAGDRVHLLGPSAAEYSAKRYGATP